MYKFELRHTNIQIRVLIIAVFILGGEIVLDLLDLGSG